jgi:hypothetical protein
MDERQAKLTETRSSTDDGELKLEIKVLRTKLRTSLKGGTTGAPASGKIWCQTPTQ